MSEQASPALADAVVLDEQEQPHKVSELWSDKPAVILWVRHFG
jgi:hypothetical protein